MTGIYSLTSPSGKVYIGQSWNIEKRHRHYRTASSCKAQIALARSIAKYGYENHIVKTLYELPSDITQKVLDEYEIFFINQYKEAGIVLLNMKGGGFGAKMEQSSIDKIKAARAKQTPPTLGKVCSDITKERIRVALTGKKASPEAVEKSRQARIGMKATEETRAKLRAARALKNHWVGRKHSDEAKQKQSLKKIGHKINNKKVICIDTGIIYDSITDAAIYLNIKPKTLSARIRKKTKVSPLFTYHV